MKPVYQEIIDPNRGDCMSACFASLLGLDIKEVPKFLADYVDQAEADMRVSWHQRQTEWLASRGFHFRYIPWKVLNDWVGLEGALCIASMPSQKFPGNTHAVIGSWKREIHPEWQTYCYVFTVVHDPNPGNAPYPPDVSPVGIGFLIPLDPEQRACA